VGLAPAPGPGRLDRPHRLARLGLGELALRVLTGVCDAGLHFELHHMPELFCSCKQNAGAGSVRYPLACAKQAWSAGLGLSLVFRLVWVWRLTDQKDAFVSPVPSCQRLWASYGFITLRLQGRPLTSCDFVTRMTLGSMC
jgi:hypothetical protein